jgi:hypothetical protein
MEGLANEKQALEQRLASEHKALSNEKQGLADQLKDAVQQLKEAQALLEVRGRGGGGQQGRE